MLKSLRAAVVTVAAVLASALPSLAQTYSNITQLNIGTSTTVSVVPSSPYGTTISVTNAPTRIKTLSVAIQNINHSYASDLQALLVSPGGQKILLVSQAASNTNLVAQTWIFNQEATQTLPTTFGVPSVSGTYRPTVTNTAAFPAPAPSTPYSTNLADLYGTNANGTWTLYVCDAFPGFSGGTILGGWTITFVGDIETAFTYQGILRNASGPISGSANVRFSLMNYGVPTPGESALGTVTKSLTGIVDGRITTSVDFGNVITQKSGLWLKIEVAAPSGGSYVEVTPRQQITISPQAGRALVANSAESVPWSGVTGVPTAVSVAPGTFQVSVTSQTVASVSSVTPVTFPGSSVSVNMNAGRALVNWSVTGFTSSPNSSWQIRPRIGSVVGPWTTFFFNPSGQHMTISGTAVLVVPAGTQNFSLEIQRTSGNVSFNVDTQDSLTATILNLPN
ncbi:MAG: proprotein convertase P-domain-containing protein [Phycisphaerales bacterium]|nr:proprotein convertase P-domain-containing protein [Phycisphaerales bacterium]